MKGTADRTKVVLRQLPPTITQSTLMEQIDGRFAGRYNWVSFRPGNNSLKHQSYSRAYINFEKPEDVIEFAEFFDGHVFVNEKGTQFKTIIEYAPSQRVPKQGLKKDGREGTLLKDPEYLEFLESIAKPVENLPSAEIQLERREAEKAGAAKDAPIITPLMQFVLQKRAAKGGSRKSLSNGKPIRRIVGTSSGSPSSAPLKRGSEKRRVSTSMYVLKDNAKSTSGKDKSTYMMVPKRDDLQNSEKSVSVMASGTEISEDSGMSGSSETGKKKILLLKGKEKEIPIAPGSFSSQHMSASPVKNSITVPRQNPRREPSGRIIRSIILNKDSRQTPPVLHSETQFQASNQDKDKRPPRPPNVPLSRRDTNGGAPEDRVAVNDSRGFYAEKQERRTRNRDNRPDRGVWAPLCRSEGSHVNDESLSSSASQQTQSLPDPAEGTRGDAKNYISRERSREFKHFGSGRGGHSSVDNGSYRHGDRRMPPYNGKDADGSTTVWEGKPLKRGVSSGHVSQERQVWVQKSSSAGS